MPFSKSVCLLALCTFLPGWAAGAPASKDMQIVQRIDDVLLGVDVVSLEVLDRTHVAGTYFLINLHQPSPVAGYAQFVADCKVPLRLATLASSLPSATLVAPPPLQARTARPEMADVAALDFRPVHMLDGSWMVADFACRASSQPSRAPQIARQLLETGGPPDTRALYCDLRPDGSTEVRRSVPIRYSVADDAVAVQAQWLSSGFVSDTEVLFGSGAQWVVDRLGDRARLIGTGGALLFTGACEASGP
jgi:hypothetical protein